MRSLLLTSALVPLLSLPAWAGSFSIDLNDHSTQLGYSQKLNTQSYGDSSARVRYLYNDDTRTHLAGIAGGVSGSPGTVDGLTLGLEVALNGGQARDDYDFLALGLGFNGEYMPPAMRGLGFDTHLIYSPDIFAFIDAEEYLEWGLGTSYQVLPNAKVTLAYQKVEVGLQGPGKKDLDDTIRVGVKFEF